MTMPFRQKKANFCAPCTIREYKQVVDDTGAVSTIVDDDPLPPVEKMTIQARIKAGKNLEDVRPFIGVQHTPNEDEA